MILIYVAVGMVASSLAVRSGRHRARATSIGLPPRIASWTARDAWGYAGR